MKTLFKNLNTECYSNHNQSQSQRVLNKGSYTQSVRHGLNKANSKKVLPHSIITVIVQLSNHCVSRTCGLSLGPGLPTMPDRKTQAM